MYRQQEMDNHDALASTKPYPEEPSKKTNSKIYFFIIAIAALLATNVYFYVKFKSSGEKLYTVAIQKQDLQIEIDRIEAELDKLVSMNIAGADSVMNASELLARKGISDLRAKLENQTITEEDIAIASAEVAKLKMGVSDLRTTLDDVRARNELLQQENEVLARQVSSAGEKVSALSNENLDLKNKISIASALKVSNIQVNGISISKRGRMETESRNRRVDQLQILFSIADNALTQKGDKEIFVRVVDPSGNLFGDAANWFYVHGEKLQYTFKESINFTNKGEEYQFLWPQDKFKKGAYTVLLYNDNAIMGRASVVLK